MGDEVRGRFTPAQMSSAAKPPGNRGATIADLQRGKNTGELRSEAEPEVLNDAIFGALYYRLLLRSGPLTRRFGEDLVEQVIRGHRSETT